MAEQTDKKELKKKNNKTRKKISNNNKKKTSNKNIGDLVLSQRLIRFIILESQQRGNIQRRMPNSRDYQLLSSNNRNL
jgi:hypothetical protein